MNTNTQFETFYLDVTHINNEDIIADTLKKRGVITFDKIRSTEELLYLSMRLGTIVHHRDSDADGLTRIATRDKVVENEGYEAFSSGSLALHTDRSSATDPPTFIILWCSMPAREGGVSLFVDGKQIYKVLIEQFPHMFKLLSKPNSAIFRGGDTLLKSSIFSTLDNGNICVRFRYDSLGYYESSLVTILPTFLDILDQYKISFPLERYQGYIIQNGRWLHGRTLFQGDREVYRILVTTKGETSPSKSVHLGFNPLF